jgi:amicoumacin kinase
MDPKISTLYSAAILEAACQRYEIAPESIHILDGFESYIYIFPRPYRDYILRIGHSSRRSQNMIRGEVDWINYLSDGGTTAARAVDSPAGNLVEAVEDGQGGQFLCTAFEKAPGATASQEQRNDRLYLNYGRLMGRMHALARSYQPAEPDWKRPEWDDPVNMSTNNWMPEKYKAFLPKYRQLMAHLVALPRDTAGYGMIHQDAHLGNLFVDCDYTLTIFDFDDCVYGHFIYDIAMAVFYIPEWDEKDVPGFIGRFMPVFLKGYREYNKLDPRWLAELPYFLKLREIDLFAEILFMDGENPMHPWSAQYMLDRRERIERDQPFIKFDWESLGKYL